MSVDGYLEKNGQNTLDTRAFNNYMANGSKIQ